MSTPADIRRTILSILHDCDSYSLAKEILLEHLQSRLGKWLKMPAMEAEMRLLADRCLIESQVDAIGDEKWFITSAGKVTFKQ